MSDANNMSTPAPRRWLGPAFLGSLVVNLFLVGLIASALWMHRPPKFHGGGPLPFILNGDRASLNQEDRTAMRQMMRSQFKTVLPYLKEMDRSRTELAKVVGQTPYDPVKVRDAFAHFDQVQAEVSGIMREALVKGFGAMSDDQRERIAKVMEENAEHRWDRRKERHGDDSDDDGRDHGPDHDSGPGPDRPSMP